MRSSDLIDRSVGMWAWTELLLCKPTFRHWIDISTNKLSHSVQCKGLWVGKKWYTHILQCVCRIKSDKLLNWNVCYRTTIQNKISRKIVQKLHHDPEPISFSCFFFLFFKLYERKSDTGSSIASDCNGKPLVCVCVCLLLSAFLLCKPYVQDLQINNG